jgi:hypothetical protein
MPLTHARLSEEHPAMLRGGSARLGSARLGSARLGSARLGSARLGSFLLLIALPAACSRDKGESVGRSTAALSVPSASYSLVLETPADVDIPDVAVGAEDQIQVGALASVKRVNGAPALLANDGPNGVKVQPNATAGQIDSESPVTLLPNSHLLGGIRAPSTSVSPNAVVDGPIDSSTPLTPAQTWSFTVDFPAGDVGDVSVRPHDTATLGPGRYHNLTLSPHATLLLGSGSYYVDKLDLKPNSHTVLEQNAGATRLFVQQIASLAGDLGFPKGNKGFVVAQVGASPVTVHLAFSGVLVAPNANLELADAGSAHHGAFFAHSVKIGAKASVVYEPPNALVSLLFPPGTDLQRCADLIRPREDLTGKDRDRPFQSDIAEFCTMVGADECATDLVARANVDFFMVAGALIGGTITPAQYLAVVRDRERKLRAARLDPSLAAALCAGPDSDGDWVPDASDNCPGTPELTQTDDHGCTDPNLPDAPSPDLVKQAFAASGLLFGGKCNGAMMLQRIPAGAYYRTDDPQLGSFILSGRVSNQPPGCPVWYFFDIEEYLPGTFQIVKRYQVAFKDTEEAAAFFGKALTVPPGFIQFHALPSDAGTRGLLGIAGPIRGLRFRVRAMNGAGMRSQWSAWKFTTNEECLALGFICEE